MIGVLESDVSDDCLIPLLNCPIETTLLDSMLISSYARPKGIKQNKLIINPSSLMSFFCFITLSLGAKLEI